jgi:hypothetical protein
MRARDNRSHHQRAGVTARSAALGARRPARRDASAVMDLASGWRAERLGRQPTSPRASLGAKVSSRASLGRRHQSAPPASGSRPDAVFANSVGPLSVRRTVSARRAASPRRPSLRLRGPRMVAALALLAVLAVGALAGWALTTPTLRVHHVRVVGTHDPTLLAAITALPLTGCPIFYCDASHAAALVAALPAVARAEVQVEYPDTLVVHVTPRVPILIWRVAGQPYLVAADGTLIGLADLSGAAKLPQVDDPQAAALGATGHARPGARLARPLVEMAAQLLNALPGVLGAGVTLSYDASLGLVADTGQGLRVAFGDPTRPPNDAPAGVRGQLAALRAMLALLAQQGQTAEWIDLRWGAHPAYRLAGT